MKNLTLFLLILLIASTGCNKKQEQIEQLQTENQELSTSLEECNARVKNYRDVLNEIEAKIFQTFDVERQPGEAQNFQQLKARMNTTIAEVDSLLMASEERAQALRNRTYRISSRVAQLEEEIDTLNLTVQKKDSIITGYKEQVAELNYIIEELSTEIEGLNDRITEMTEEAEMLTDELHFAWYISGTEEELLNMNIIKKTGGFLGFLGQAKVINPQLEPEQLEKIDIRESTVFEMGAPVDNLLMVSPHSQASYSIEPMGEDSASLTIDDLDEFWKVSEYLVVVTDD